MDHIVEAVGGGGPTLGRRSCGSGHSRPPPAALGRAAALLLALLLVAASFPRPARAQKWKAALEAFTPAGDVPTQRAALLRLLNAVGRTDSRLLTDDAALVVGNPGIEPWGANSSYCTWWGVNCCGSTLTTSLELCQNGANSVSALHVAAVGLVGQLPDVFDDLPDVSLIDMAFNRGLSGTLPESIGRLRNLWLIDITGTSVTCSGILPPDLFTPGVKPPPGVEPACPLPGWLRFSEEYYFQANMLECPGVTFTQPRAAPQLLQRAFIGASTPEVFVESTFFNGTNCVSAEFGPGKLGMPVDPAMGIPIVVLVILVPSLAVSVGLVLLSVALMRYLRYLKRSHDAIHLTEGWKRRNPPGVISDGNDRVLREVTVVITDVEGSTELWEWDHGVMNIAQELHDNVMRDLISKYCGFEVTTEGDSFTIAFHDAFDAVSWALAMQQAMLDADWPEALLSHEKARVVLSTAGDSSRPGQLLFRGLRVRVAISTGIPTVVRMNEMTNTLTYGGPVMESAAALADLPAGGQVLLGPNTFSSIVPRLAEMGVRLLLTEGQHHAEAEAHDAGRKRWGLFGFGGGGGGGAQGIGARESVGGRRLHQWLSRGSSLAVSGRLFSGGPDAEAPSSETLNGKPRRQLSADAPFHDAPLPGAADNEHVPLVIDMGSHWLDGMQPLSQVNNPSALMGIRLTQIIARHLAPRAGHFPPLKTFRSVYPSYFEAPSAADALLPDGMVFKGGALPDVTIAFCAPDSMRPLEALSERLAKDALDMYSSVVRTTLTACRGYECQEKDGIFMLVFGDVVSAVEWACVLQVALLRVHWSPELLRAPVCAEVCDEGGEVVFRGVRAKIGLYKGDITRIIPHRATGRADFFGPPVNRAARFLSAAAPGQVLAERRLVEEAVALWEAGVVPPPPWRAAAAPGGGADAVAGAGAAAAPAAAAAAAASAAAREGSPQRRGVPRISSGGAARLGAAASKVLSGVLEESTVAAVAAGSEGGQQPAGKSFSFVGGAQQQQQQQQQQGQVRVAIAEAEARRLNASGSISFGRHGSSASAAAAAAASADAKAGAAGAAPEAGREAGGGGRSFGRVPTLAAGLALPVEGEEEAAAAAAAARRRSDELPPSPFLRGVPTSILAPGDGAATAAAAADGAAAAPREPRAALRVQFSGPVDPSEKAGGPAGAPALRTPSAPPSSIRRAGLSFLGVGVAAPGAAPTAAAPPPPPLRGFASEGAAFASDVDESMVGFDDAASEADDDAGSDGGGERGGAGPGDPSGRRHSDWRHLLGGGLFPYRRGASISDGSGVASPAAAAAAAAAAVVAAEAEAEAGPAAAAGAAAAAGGPPALPPAGSPGGTRHLSFLGPGPGPAAPPRALPRGGGGSAGASGSARRAAGMYGLISALQGGGPESGPAPAAAAAAAAAAAGASDEDLRLRGAAVRVPSVPQLPPAPLGDPRGRRRSSGSQPQQEEGESGSPGRLPGRIRRLHSVGSATGEDAPTAAALARLRAGSVRPGSSGAWAVVRGALPGLAARLESGQALTGGLPLEALAHMHLSYRLSKNNSYMLQALSGRGLLSQRPLRVRAGLQVHALGTWTFKGISGEHSVVQLLPAQLAARLYLSEPKRSSKAACVHAESGLLYEGTVEMVNVDAILFDPSSLDAAGGGGGGGGGSGPAGGGSGPGGGSGDRSRHGERSVGGGGGGGAA
ncbi:adenylate cyclase [Raphidocelis subcapitata]|uniref:Adenylate cyclase n=1 Tax=Raphidocelis subcapitata TaxID=307507 RepID=A0A2V0P558_9CHLO|nr:adenylate cyclase [Raphidocelis subcapitata]|eukprot:GBF94709.1 adenylate cyclase [Raphidocelis subcapitata]